MVLQVSGAISLSQIQTEHGGANPISLSEYYRGGGLVANISQNNSIPTSGTISLSNFYGSAAPFTVTFTTNSTNVNLYNTAISLGWNGSNPLIVVINGGVYLYSTSTGNAGLTIPSSLNGKITSFTNYGYIIGQGGTGGGHITSGGGAGGIGLRIEATGVTITNASGAYIAGGGGGGGRGKDSGESELGGGGGGAGGGTGGTTNNFSAGGQGGGPGQAGETIPAVLYGEDNNNSLTEVTGGGAGGAGGNADWTGSDKAAQRGSGGGRILPGSGGLSLRGGDGGSAGNAGGYPPGQGGGGGGGWGAAGSSGSGGSSGGGGGGGAAISATVAYTLSNSGTIYGAT